MHKSRFGITAAVLCGLLLGVPAFAQTPAGSVIFAAGDVRIVDSAGRERYAVKGAPVSEGDTLVSGARASAQLRMKDGGFIALRPQSRLRIDTYVYNGKEDGNERSLLSLLKGGFRTITGLIGLTRKDRYQVRTPTATIGIRGTDHEPLYIAPPAPGERPIGPPGTYDKVNVGIAYIETPAGTIDVLPNQVGFAAPGAIPQVLPQIPEFFKATGEPSEARARVAAAVEQAAALRERVASDLESVRRESLPALPPRASIPEPILRLIATNDAVGTANLTEQTITDLLGNTIPLGAPAPTGLAAVVSYAAPPGRAAADDFGGLAALIMRDPATGAPYAFGEAFGGFKWGMALVSPISAVPPAVTVSPIAGIEYGRWNGGIVEQSWTAPIGIPPGIGDSEVNLPRWGYAPEGYLDPLNQTLTGSYSYTPDGSTTPVDSVTGLVGSLNSATFTADFGASTWTASVDVKMAAETWTASATGIPFFGNNGAASVDPSAPGNLIVTKASCSAGCFLGGSIDWGFTGQNYRGVLLGYNIYELPSATPSDAYLADIGGTVAFTNSGATTINPGAPDTPTGSKWVYDTNTGLTLTPTILVGSGGLLTGYSVDYGSGFILNASTSTGTTGTVTNALDSATGIVLGSWDSGATSYVYGQPLGDVSGNGQLHWAVGPQATPLYLPQVLTGTATYSLDGATPPTNHVGVAGTLNSASLLVDFNKQTVDVGLDVTVNAHNWVASAAGMRLDGQRFDSFDAVTPMTVTVDPAGAAVTGNGELSGSLMGNGMIGAAVSYAMNAFLGTGPEAVNGVAAFKAPAQDTAAPYRIVGVAGHAMGSGTDPFNFVNGEFNADSRVTFDGSGNATLFDSSTSGVSAPPAVTVADVANTLLEAQTDPTTGISWGRWAGGAIDVTDRATGSPTRFSNPGSLHWIAGPAMTGPVALPTSGTYAYTHVGGTTPTDQAGVTGTLNTATLSANFTAMTVDAQVKATVNATTLDGLAQGMAIMPRGHFGTETGTMTVNCTGTCGNATAGAMGGAFTGPTGAGAALIYNMNTTGGGLAAPVEISGAAAFKR